jgi:hypothetical protein
MCKAKQTEGTEKFKSPTVDKDLNKAALFAGFIVVLHACPE